MDLYDLVTNLVKASNEREFINDRRRIGRFFFDASKDESTSALLRGVRFNGSLGYPSSNELNEVIRDLQLTGQIGRFNPTYLTNTIEATPIEYDDIEFASEEEKTQFLVLLEGFRAELCYDAK